MMKLNWTVGGAEYTVGGGVYSGKINRAVGPPKLVRDDFFWYSYLMCMTNIFCEKTVPNIDHSVLEHG